MITERNSIISEITDMAKVKRETNRLYAVLSAISLVVGTIGIIAYIVLGTVWETLYEYTPKWCDALLVFAVPFALGLVFTLTLRSQSKQIKKSNSANVYEFFADGMLIRETRGGEEVAVVRADYNKILKISENWKYIKVRFINVFASLPIDKSTFTEEELFTVKKLLSLKIPQDARTLELAPCSESFTEISLEGKDGKGESND